MKRFLCRYLPFLPASLPTLLFCRLAELTVMLEDDTLLSRDAWEAAVQETIRSCAAAEQQIIFEACEKVAPADDYCPSKGYRRYGGPAMEDMLATVPLIDAHYLVRLAKLGGILPRGQDVPATALITRASAWRLRRWSTQFSLPPR